MDKKTGFKTRNLLCQPIRSHRGGGPIIRIIQLLNKINADAFDNVDEDMLSQFMGLIADILGLLSYYYSSISHNAVINNFAAIIYLYNYRFTLSLIHFIHFNSA